MTRCLLPSAGSPRSGSPASSVLLDTPTPHRPSPLASFPSLGGTALAPRVSLPDGPGRLPSGAWVLVSGPPTGVLKAGTMRPPRFLGHPKASAPCSPTPAGPLRQAITALRCCRRMTDSDGSRVHLAFEAQSHGSLASLSTLRSCGSPRLHARLGSGWWPAFAGQDSTCWVPQKVSAFPLPPFSGFPLHQASLAHSLSASLSQRRIRSVGCWGDPSPATTGKLRPG